MVSGISPFLGNQNPSNSTGLKEIERPARLFFDDNIPFPIQPDTPYSTRPYHQQGVEGLFFGTARWVFRYCT